MRLGTLLIAGSAAAALPPLLLLGYAATEVATRAVNERAFALHAQEADGLATWVDTWFEGHTQAVSLLRQAFPVEDLSVEERVGFERLVYNQQEEINVVSLLDAAGVEAAPSQRVAPGSAPPDGHEIVDDARLAAFRAHLPLAAIEEGDEVVGTPYLPPGGEHHVAPVLFPGVGEDGLVLAVELSLATVEARLESLAGPTTEVALLDLEGRPFSRTGDALVRAERFTWFLQGVPAAELQYDLESGERVAAAFSRVERTGWLAVVAEPWTQIVAPARGIRLRAAWFGLVGLGLAGALGLHFAGKIHRPVLELRDAARALGEGRRGHQVRPDPIAELGELAEAFNTMSAQLQEDAVRIASQQEEIQVFNAELQRRVEERTRALEAAQERLVAAGKQAAVAELGAGLAHELNNPLAAILGITQILAEGRRDGADGALLASLEQQVERCAGIVRALLAFAEDGVRPVLLEQLDLEEVLAEVSALVAPTYRQRGLSLTHTPGHRRLPVRADRAQLGRALAQLVSSLRSLLSEGGCLRIHATEIADEIQVELAFENGPGEARPVHRDDWMAAGMSLWIARRILSEHGGRLKEPPPDRDAPFMLLMPRA